MRSLATILRLAADALDETPSVEHIKVWPFRDAPRGLKALSENGGDEDWLAFVPDQIDRDYWIPWLEVPGFGICRVHKYPAAGGVVYIGCHA